MAKKAPTSPTNRSRVTNGATLFVAGSQVDGRSAIARRFRDHIADLSAQLGGDTTPAQDMLIRRAATLAVLAELDEAKIAAGEPVAETAYIVGVNALSGVLNRLGLQRRPKNVTPPKKLDGHTLAILEGDDDA